MTAENSSQARRSASATRFNEAAADDRGKRRWRLRPRPGSARGFNEAAADDRGKPWVPGELVGADQLLQ